MFVRISQIDAQCRTEEQWRNAYVTILSEHKLLLKTFSVNSCGSLFIMARCTFTSWQLWILKKILYLKIITFNIKLTCAKIKVSILCIWRYWITYVVRKHPQIYTEYLLSKNPYDSDWESYFQWEKSVKIITYTPYKISTVATDIFCSTE